MEIVLIFALLVLTAYLILYVRGRLYKYEAFYEETRDGSLYPIPEDGSEESI